MSEWEEVGGMTENTWDYKNMEKGSEFIGTYKKTRENVGENNSKMHIFQKDDEEWAMWGCYVLDKKMEDVFEGEKAKIVYLGKEEGDKRPYHNFQIFTKKVEKKEDVDPDDIPF